MSIRHQRAMVKSVQLRLQLFLRCLLTSEIPRIVRGSPGSIALDLSNESDCLARLAEIACLQRGALLQLISLLRWRQRGLCLGFGSSQKRHKQTRGPCRTATHVQHTAHACVEEDTVCTVVRWLLIDKLILRFCRVQSPFFGEDRFRPAIANRSILHP